jgi:pyruvate/2-oxoglutarate/acetoin dehydrogenase E1 component
MTALTALTVRPERVAENLNRALHEVMCDDPAVVLFGEDITDPYGGAFKIRRVSVRGSRTVC